MTAALIDDLERARPALPRAGLRARLPALLALRHAAPLLRQVELVRRHLRRPATGCSPTTRRSAGTPSTSSTAASANGSRTTSTGRSPATATGGRRCRSGSAPARTATAASAPARSPSCASAPAARSPTTCTAPTSTRSSLDCEKCGGEMRRVESVIDTWYDSGAMPFAQFHYPFENEELFEERFPADFICEAIDQTRGWFYTLLAESTLLFDTSSYRNCVCLGLILDPEGQKMSKSKGNVVEPWDVIAAHGADAFRWYYLTASSPGRATASRSTRSANRCASSSSPSGTPTPSGSSTRTPRASAPRTSAPAGSDPKARREGPGPVGALAPAGDRRDRPRAHGRLRLHRRRPGDRRVRRGALQLVRAALAPALLGRRPGRLRDPAPLPAGDGGDARALHPVPRRRDPPQPRRRRGRGARRAARLGPPARLPRGRPGARRPRAGGRDGGRPPARSSSAAPPAPRPRRRCASRCAAP